LVEFWSITLPLIIISILAIAAYMQHDRLSSAHSDSH